MLEDLLFLSSAFVVVAFLTSTMFKFTNMTANWIFAVSFVILIVVIVVIGAALIIDHGVVDKLHAWWS